MTRAWVVKDTSLKKDFMEKMADVLLNLDKEEKKEFMGYVIDTMGESFFADMSKEEKAQVMGDAIKDLLDRSGLTDSKERKDLLISLTEGLVDRFTGDMGPGEKGVMLSDLVTTTVRKVGPELKAALSSAIRELTRAGPAMAKDLKSLLTDPEVRHLLRDLVRELIKVLRDLLMDLTIEVYGYVKDSAPEVQAFVRETARELIKALSAIAIEVLKKLMEVVGEIMQVGGKLLVDSKDIAKKVLGSDEMRAIKGRVDSIIDEKSGLISTLLEEGVSDLEDLAERTKMPRETLRNLLLKMWEKGEVEMDIGRSRPGGSAPSD